MVVKKMTSEQFIKDATANFEEGDSLKWEDGYISYYGSGMAILSEYNVETGEAYIY